MEISTNYEPLKNEINDIIKLFFQETKEDVSVSHVMSREKDKVINYCLVKGDITTENSTTNDLPKFTNSIDEKKYFKRFAKLCIYQTLSRHFDKNLPWGALTGIRPTKIAYELVEQGVDPYLIKETLVNNFLVSDEKAMLVASIIRNQNCIIKNDKLIDLYVNIPFCPSRCSYCSFISSIYCEVEKIIPDYIECLIKEIRAVKQIIFEKAYVIRTIYIGGGTPTSLKDEELELILRELSYPVSEFTVECGRPDTITKSKLDLLEKYKVTRICINPQTFNSATLKRIGRAHTVNDIIEAYKLSLNYDFDVNMDVIAGLPGEKFPQFKKTIDTCLELSPANITVHTLSLKQGSVLSQSDDVDEVAEAPTDVIKMMKYANEKLCNDGYKPYYLYRQKNQIAGLENVGYTKEGKVCLFNVDSMEETCSIIACGANAISKRVFHLENRIEREANVKFAKDYIDRIDEMIDRKKKLFN